MMGPAITLPRILFQVSTPPPETGVDELVGFWPVLVRFAWFLVGFLTVVLLGRLLVEPFLTPLLSRRNRNNPTVQAAFILYVRLVGLLVATIVGGVVAGYGWLLGDSALVLSAVALAIGIAAREVVSSLASGVALVLDSEFNVGDYIRWPGGEGIVRSIALRVTRVETVSGELVTVPNAILTGNEITRPYGRGHHRIAQEIEITHDGDVAEVLAQLEAVADTTEGILAAPSPTAYVDELGETVTIQVHYWIDDPTRREVLAIRSAYARAAKNRLEAEGITIGPPDVWRVRGEVSLDTSS
jgi:small-conductance mechanosensitive channel